MATKLDIYVFALEESKFYVGVTEDFDTREQTHRNGKGSAWTKKYKVIKLVERFQGDKFDEEKTLLRYMDTYGINNVRGGSYSNVELSQEQYLQARRSIANANGVCLACEQNGHFLRNCTAQICYRCGRYGHEAKDCCANNHVDGMGLMNCYHCGMNNHYAPNCRQNYDIYGRPIIKQKPEMYSDDEDDTDRIKCCCQ